MIGTGCPVGEWALKVQTGRTARGTVAETYPSYTYQHFIFILFNPWKKGTCFSNPMDLFKRTILDFPEDPVYLEDEKLRREYVLKESGAVWQGVKWDQTAPCPWDFGQFEDVALYSALLALRMSKGALADIDRADPVLVVRALTEAVW